MPDLQHGPALASRCAKFDPRRLPVRYRVPFPIVQVTECDVVRLFLGLLALIAAGYGLHRICIALENHGLLYYLRKPPGASAGSPLIVLQEVAEPAVKHVIRVEDHQERSTNADDPTTDTGRPPGPTIVDPRDRSQPSFSHGKPSAEAN